MHVLEDLFHSPGWSCPIDEVANRYSVTANTIKNDVKEINRFLASIPTEPLRLTGKGMIKAPESLDERSVHDALRRMDAYVYKLSASERRDYILARLLASREHVPMRQIARELEVTRNTIAHDVWILGKRLEKQGASLVLKPGKGMILNLGVRERLDLVVHIFKEAYAAVSGGECPSGLILDRLGAEHSFASVLEHVRAYARRNRLISIDEELYGLALGLAAVIHLEASRSGGAFCAIGDASDVNREVRRMALQVATELCAHISEQGLEELQRYLDRHRLRPFVKKIDQIELYKAVVRFVRELDPDNDYNLIRDGALIEMLLAHVLSTRDWEGPRVELPTEETGIDYAEIERKVNERASILEEALSHQLSEDVRRSLVIHICAGIMRNRHQPDMVTVAIACPSSVATGAYLEAQIKTFFGFRIIGLFAVHDVLRKIEEQPCKIDFIISTVFIPQSRHPVVKVHPYLQMEDLNLIQAAIVKTRTARGGMPADLLLDYVRSNITDRDLAKVLCKRIRRTIREHDRVKTRRAPSALHHMLREDQIAMLDRSISWREAMREVAAPLLRKGLIEDSYIGAMVANVEEFGDYFVVGEGVALAHAKAEDGVNRDCLSLLVSARGIAFDQTPRPVHLLFCLATLDVRPHVGLLKAIISLGTQPEAVRDACSLSDPGGVVSMLGFEQTPACRV